jgi:CHAT domain-containing protein
MLDVSQDQLLTGSAANINVVRKKVRGAKLLYFATHGIADPENPLDGSGLFFAPSDDNPTGLWTAREIQGLKLENGLVILSACQTGLGDPQDAGTIGLSRAFQLAGATHTIMSLWSVDDQSTMELMTKFVKYLQEGGGVFPVDPLRNAILAYKKENPNPLHWASFSVFGIPLG